MPAPTSMIRSAKSIAVGRCATISTKRPTLNWRIAARTRCSVGASRCAVGSSSRIRFAPRSARRKQRASAMRWRSPAERSAPFCAMRLRGSRPWQQAAAIAAATSSSVASGAPSRTLSATVSATSVGRCGIHAMWPSQLCRSASATETSSIHTPPELGGRSRASRPAMWTCRSRWGRPARRVRSCSTGKRLAQAHRAHCRHAGH